MVVLHEHGKKNFISEIYFNHKRITILKIPGCKRFLPDRIHTWLYLALEYIKEMAKQILIEITCFLLALVFTYAAFSKLFEYHFFKIKLQRSPITAAFAKAAWMLPVTELITAALLVVKPLQIAGLYFSLSLMTFFTVYISGMLLFSKDLPCTCGGVIEQLTWKQHLLFNFFFLGISFSGIILYRKQKYTVKNMQY